MPIVDFQPINTSLCKSGHDQRLARAMLRGSMFSVRMVDRVIFNMQYMKCTLFELDCVSEIKPTSLLGFLLTTHRAHRAERYVLR